ncbi:MAG: hypothetical protein LBI31_00550 [Zoogloeaceae bacterium]|jgi:hypothetical protein|nr:hypothetical protein [Zoogloeaceae bacterium]
MQAHHFRVELTPHPDSSAPEVRRITVEGKRQQEILDLSYELEGDWSGFLFPDARHPAPPDRLWAHGCCELFWREANAAAYREYNFSPSLQWASYAFFAYRARQEDVTQPAPRNMNWERDDSRLVLRVESPVFAGSLRLALAVVLERARNGEILYYALRHPPGLPDFHHPDNFILNLP